MQVSPLMPTHILASKKKGRLSKVCLARQALHKLPVKIEDGQLVSITDRLEWDHQENINFCRLPDGRVDLSKIENDLCRKSFRSHMQGNKNFRRISANLFEAVCDETKLTKEGGTDHDPKTEPAQAGEL